MVLVVSKVDRRRTVLRTRSVRSSLGSCFSSGYACIRVERLVTEYNVQRARIAYIRHVNLT